MGQLKSTKMNIVTTVNKITSNMECKIGVSGWWIGIATAFILAITIVWFVWFVWFVCLIVCLFVCLFVCLMCIDKKRPQICYVKTQRVIYQKHKDKNYLCFVCIVFE